MAKADQSTQVRNLFDRLKAGDEAAKDALITHVYKRAHKISQRELRGFPNVKRWDETDDIWHEAMLRLRKALDKTHPETVDGLLGLAAQNIRWTLQDLVRRNLGAHGLGQQQELVEGDSTKRDMEVQADTAGPRTLAEYTELHQIVEQMPGDIMPTFELCYYNGLTQEAAAEILGVEKRTVQRRMRAAKRWLAERLRDEHRSD